MSLCEALHQQDQAALDRLKRNSIYLQADDTDHDFEFFVFFDAANEERRPLFLQALRVALGIDTASQSQVVSQCRQDWDERFQGRSAAKPEFSLLNWLKIAIEDYPFRLFVVIDPEKWKHGKSHPLQAGFWKDQCTFLRKRICFIDGRDFTANFPEGDDIDKASYDRFKNWLYAQWVLHLFRSRYTIEPERVQIFLHRLDDPKDVFYVPSTASFFYTKASIEIKDKNSQKSNIKGLIRYALDFKKIDIDDSILPGKDNPQIYISRHADVFEIEGSDWNTGELVPRKNTTWVSYNLSGELASFIHYQEALYNKSSPSSIQFFLSVIEHALTRVAIADERIQEWNERMSLQEAASLYLSRIIGLYCFANAEKIEGQGCIPEHKIYLKSDLLQRDLSLNWGEGIGDNFEELWPERFKEIDLMIIHQGLLDKFINTLKGKSIEDYILQWKDVIPSIIVTSGRGKPEDAPQSTKFLPFSGLEGCLIGKRFDKQIFLRQIVSI